MYQTQILPYSLEKYFPSFEIFSNKTLRMNETKDSYVSCYILSNTVNTKSRQTVSFLFKRRIGLLLKIGLYYYSIYGNAKHPQ